LGRKGLRGIDKKHVGRGRETFFVADFYCHDRKLALEIDGQIHEHQKHKDEKRRDLIESMEIQAIRHRNEEEELRLETVMRRLAATISKQLSSSLSRVGVGPLLRAERGWGDEFGQMDQQRAMKTRPAHAPPGSDSFRGANSNFRDAGVKKNIRTRTYTGNDSRPIA